MKQQFRLYRRDGGIYYIHNDKTGKQRSLGTRDRVEASALFAAETQSHRQAHLNLRLARTYLAATDPMVSKRTWQNAMEELAKMKHGATLERWKRAIKDKAFNSIRELPILETQAEHFLKVLNTGKVSTNVFLRRVHNFALDMGWLPWPIIVKRQWPEIRFKEKRAITYEEHRLILEREKNSERKAYYRLAWHLGASQSDLANLHTEDVDWQTHIISFVRKKTATVCIMRFDEDIAQILRDLPGEGPLFPYLRTVRAGDRATEFKQRCNGLGIKGVSLHSYRYAWAERAKAAGYPERYAQVNLGHNSKAMTRSYSRKATVELPSLSEYERRQNAMFGNGNIEPKAQAVNT
jgi:integrase